MGTGGTGSRGTEGNRVSSLIVASDDNASDLQMLQNENWPSCPCPVPRAPCPVPRAPVTLLPRQCPGRDGNSAVMGAVRDHGFNYSHLVGICQASVNSPPSANLARIYLINYD